MDAKERPRRSHQTLIFKAYFANFVLRDPLGGRSRCALLFENMQYHIGFIHVFDALIDSMLDHRTVTKNQKTSATLHGNASAKNGTSATLHGNAFRAFMVQLGASKSSPGDRTKHSFSNHFLRNLVLVGAHLVAAPGVITPGGAPRRGTDGRTDGSFTPGVRTNNSFIFRCRFANSALRDPLGGR